MVGIVTFSCTQVMFLDECANSTFDTFYWAVQYCYGYVVVIIPVRLMSE